MNKQEIFTTPFQQTYPVASFTEKEYSAIRRYEGICEMVGPVHLNYDGVYKQILKETREGNRNRCPFCGSENIRPIKSIISCSCWMICLNCGGTGPTAPTEKEARKAWRKRIWQKKKH